MLTVLTLRRLVLATGNRKQVQLALSSLVLGTTIWATHFIAMLAYDPGVEHGYAPFLTGVSLCVAIVGVFVSNIAFAYAGRAYGIITAGCGFGVTVSVMHYSGMSAYQVPGEIIWRNVPVGMSILLGIGFGIIAYHRILRPITRYCWLGGVAALVAAICTMHFTGMSAIDMRLNSSVTVPPQLLSDSVLGLLIFTVVALILLVGFAAIGIETNLEREARNRLEHTVLHDHLTGLPNRLNLKYRLDELIVSMTKDVTSNVIVASIDLDLFKEVNDIHGQDAGDQVLIEIATRLEQGLDDDEFIARVGGDEFIALKATHKSPDTAQTFAQLIYDRIVPPVQVGNRTIAIGASLGLATSRTDGRDLDDLVRKSDLAMYRAKQDADLHICQYDAEMDQKARAKMRLIADLRIALDNAQFELVYQLQNDATTRAPVGCEALIRWHHPTHGTISPAVFIPLAEETGLINDIGRWVIKTACAEAACWEKPWSVAVNVAPQQLAQPTFVDELQYILDACELPANRLELEVTEASVIHDQAYALRVLKQVKAMGVRIAMDDFGTGYSSLATLQAFPFDKIKIDRSFVTDLHKNRQRAAIVCSTLSLGKAFDIPVLAEGVELEAELDHLESIGCHFIQGFYFGKPMPAINIRNLAAHNTITRAS